MPGIKGYEGKFVSLGEVSLADKALSVRVERDIDTAVRSVPNRAEWLRRVITEAAQRELLNQEVKG
ncbi:MAG: hypothetical protein KME35_15855 [Aphanocapsa sp. GSE-SYN-MK-11-07L]|jgi:hypothetical protein|nr:hypothetical protein [Aphanocapsa sp. GSE-SYN-MK-11-07L]